MWQPIEILANAQSAVSRRLADLWLAYLRAALVPAIACVAAFVWMVEAYWSSIPFAAGERADVAAALSIVALLSCIATGRMVRIALKIDPVPHGLAGLGADPADGRMILVVAGFALLIAAAMSAERAARLIVAASFVVPGSGVIAKPTLALSVALIRLVLFYLLGRLSLFVPALLAGREMHPAAVWRASEGNGAILFVTVIAAPWAVALVIAGPALWWIGALPWPAVGDFASAQSLALALRAHLYLVAPALAVALISTWSLASAALCAAWERVGDESVLAAREGASGGATPAPNHGGIIE